MELWAFSCMGILYDDPFRFNILRSGDYIGSNNVGRLAGIVA